LLQPLGNIEGHGVAIVGRLGGARRCGVGLLVADCKLSAVGPFFLESQDGGIATTDQPDTA
jgi:hypothetical protein